MLEQQPTTVTLAPHYPLLPRLISRPAILASRATSRLSLIARHFQKIPVLELNTPFSIDKYSSPEDYTPFHRRRYSTTSEAEEKPVKMSSQPSHPALLIPGPIEFDDAVLQAMSHYRFDSRMGTSQGRCADAHSAASHMSVHPLLLHSARHCQCFERSSRHPIPPHNRS